MVETDSEPSSEEGDDDSLFLSIGKENERHQPLGASNPSIKALEWDELLSNEMQTPLLDLVPYRIVFNTLFSKEGIPDAIRG